MAGEEQRKEVETGVVRKGGCVEHGIDWLFHCAFVQLSVATYLQS